VNSPGGSAGLGYGVATPPVIGYAKESARRGPGPGAHGRPRGFMSETIWYLKRCPLFERLTPAEARRLEARALMRSFRPREVIYFPAEPGQTVLLLARGKVKIKAITPDGRETILAFIEAGELFGELAILDGAPRDEFAEAVEAAQVLAIPRDELLWLMGRRPDVALHVTKLLGFRLRRVENRLRNILFRSNRERTVALLLELLESHGQRAGGRWEIRLRLSHQELANLIGATRETVTVTLGQLQREGLIAVQRRRIQVLDRGRLAAEANGSMQPQPSAPRPVTRP
jgi:CRP/FNR family transcriptional regulator, cyclic AMP receptor protein